MQGDEERAASCGDDTAEFFNQKTEINLACYQMIRLYRYYVFRRKHDNKKGGNIILKENTGNTVNYVLYYDNDSMFLITPSLPLSYLTKYILSISAGLKSTAGGNLNSSTEISFITGLDPSDKFQRISDDLCRSII